jgi:glycosyltransferase involved in cell wall biosynthesis
MRIVVLSQKNIHTRADYAAGILLLLKKIAKEKNIEIIEPADASSVNTKQLPENFLLCLFHENKNAVSLRWFYDVQLLSITKKTKATLIIDLNGCSSNTLKLPQILILSDTSYLEKDRKNISITESYSRKNAASFFNKASSVITYSDVAKKFIEENFSCEKEKIKTVYPFIDDLFKPVSFNIREAIKEKYADGKEYFIALCNEEENNFIHLLKAFSVFKKWQKSNMKLLMLRFRESNEKFFQEKLSAYKYRNDVCLTAIKNEKEYAELLASSYALLHHSNKDGNILMAANALQCSVPVISTTKRTMEEFCGDAALYAEDDTPQTFGYQMISIYKDETLRNKMTAAALTQSAKFDAEKNADVLRLIVSKT